METKIKIWGEEVPCTEFLGDDISEEKKKEKWIKVISNDNSVQKWIDRNIWFANTVPYNVYILLIDNPKRVFECEIKNGKFVVDI
jgi:hypothetical protein